MSVRGYITPDGDYYETSDGPIHPEDVHIPLRPSNTYDYDVEAGTWRNTHGTMEHNYPRIEHSDSLSVALTEKKLFSIRDTLYILGILGAAGTVYFGIITEVKKTSEELSELKSTVLEHQAVAAKEIRECNDKIHQLELEQVKLGK
jgi:hypothetical protein